MTDEVARVAHEGVIYDGPEETLPYASIEEADSAVTQGLTLVRDGEIGVKRGVELLDEARRRGAWQQLDYSSWEECLEDRAAHVYRAVMDRDVRLALVARLRASGLATRGIAAITGTSAATASRDVTAVRESGLLDEEPEKVLGADGKERGTRRVPEPREEREGTPAKDTLPRRFDHLVDQLEVKGRALVDLCHDDPRAWTRNLETLLVREGDISRVRDHLDVVLSQLRPKYR